MAVMTTKQPEGASLEEKLIKTATISDDGRNGSFEVNGHVSPAKADLEPRSESLSKSKNMNENAFSTNQDLPSETNGSRVEQAAVNPMKEDDSAPSKSIPSADTEMTDAPAKSPTPPIRQQSTNAEAEGAENTVPPVTLEISPDVAGGSPASSAISPRTKDDVVMGETEDDSLEIPGANHAGSTQDTAVSDVPPATPMEDADGQAGTTTAAITNPASASPTAPQTANTSISEPSQKISREREPDSEEGPAAKRAKLVGAPVKAEGNTRVDQDRMDVDQAGEPPSLHHKNGEPKDLSDASLHAHPITDYMSKSLRGILAGVKKTKAGAIFRQPVKDLWPALWNDYSAKVTQPIDISTIEKKLRGDLPKYTTMGDFKDDVHLLVQNSILFNGEGHDVTIAATSTRDAIFTRMAAQTAVEPAKPEKKESVKQHTTRHAEPRVAAASVSAPGPSPRRPSKSATAEPAPSKPVVDSPAFAIPANNNGVPLIRRDSTKPDSRTKRPVKPAHSKDLVYDTKRKKKLSPEMRFCEGVLDELKKAKNYDINGNFMQPVDPVALNIPSYHKVVKKPMDLSTMSKKLAAGEYASAKEFERDFDLIVKNCRLFNGDEHVVYAQALKLQQLFRREFGKKDEWMAKNAPAATPSLQRTASPAPKNESEDEEVESEVEPEVDEEYKATQQRLATIQKRLEEEQKKLNDMINLGTAEMADVEIGQSVVAMLQKQLMGERSKLASMQPKKPAKSKASKPKKASAPAAGKKASAGGSGGAPKKGGGTRKAAPKFKIGGAERDFVATSISELDGPELTKAIEIIKADTGQGENDSGELELDIEQLSDAAVSKLYEISIKAFPHLKAEHEKKLAAPPPDTSTSKTKSSTKGKKNKPMTKYEQERRIAQLNELRAQATRQGSGSQEPMDSIEGNGTVSANPTVSNPNLDSDDEESSEEE